jgi:transcriptional regulator with XRE-family HTH domain
MYGADMGKKKTKISDQIRAAIKSADVTRYRIELETGIDKATLSRFMSGKGGMSVETLDKLGEYLGLEVTKTKKKRT